jgi:antirestriction protein ArdC
MNAYEIVTDRILAQLDKGIIPWKRGFDVSGPQTPTNFLTKKAYRGINVFMLFCNDYPTSEWLTYKQAQELGAQVRKGERATPIVFWSFRDKETEDGEKDSYAFCKTYSVFNIAQIDGLTPALPFDPSRVFEPIPAARALADRYLTTGPKLAHGGNQPFYSPGRDLVQMPECEKWHNSERYYKTLFHELTHSTGHPSRLNRDMGKRFGSDPYAREELVAEFGAAFLCAECGISSEDAELNTVAYIQNWIQALKNDKRLAISAAQRAQRAADFIVGRTFEASKPAELAA